MVKNITVYLDNDQRKFNDSVRCGFIVSEDEQGEESFYNDLIDSSEYHSIKELIDDIVGIFKVQRSSVLIAGWKKSF